MIYNSIDRELVNDMLDAAGNEIGDNYSELIDSFNDWFKERFIFIEIVSYRVMLENKLAYNMIKTMM